VFGDKYTGFSGPIHSFRASWLKGVAYLGLASFSCVFFTAFSPPLLTPEAASSLPLIGSLSGDLPGYWMRFALSFVLLGLAPAALAALFRETPASLGINFKTAILRSPIFWLCVPVALLVGAIGALSPDLGSYYPYSRDLIERTRVSGLAPLIGHYAAYFFLYYVPWEFFFRGFLLFPFALAAQRELERHSPIEEKQSTHESPLIAALVLFQTMPSAMLHVGHPVSELAGAVAAGIGFGILAWKTRSIIPGLILHAAIGFGTDGFIVLKGAGFLP
jgi:membrane protease YdiL (CAAX protease family)